MNQFSPGLRSFSSLRDFYFFHNYDFGPLGSPRVSEIIIWREEKEKERHRESGRREIITEIIEKNHNNEICTFPQRTLIIPRVREKQPEKKYAETMGNIHSPEPGKIRNAYANVQ